MTPWTAAIIIATMAILAFKREAMDVATDSGQQYEETSDSTINSDETTPTNNTPTPTLWETLKQQAANIGGNLVDNVKAATGNAQELSAAGLERIKAFEGFSATPYPDHKGFSVGYGHLIKSGEKLEAITEQQATALLLADTEWAARAVRQAVKVDLDQNEFDALTSLAYNIGEGAFKRSTLVQKLNAGDWSGASDQFTVWNRASEQVNSALVARRAAEQELFNTEVTA